MRAGRHGPGQGDEGAGSVLVLALVLVLFTGAVAAATLAVGLHAGARARAAADLAALAAADLTGLGIGTPGPCAAPVLDRATEVARANGAGLIGCVVDEGAAVTVEVEVATGLPGRGLPDRARARARAGPSG